MEAIKRCSKCKQSKAISEFQKHRKNTDGLQGYCKSCQKIYQKTYQQEHKQERQKYQLNYRRSYRKTIKGYLRYIWHGMLQRCNNTKNKDYKHYGGRSIKVKFVSFDDFYDYVFNELKAEPKGLTIDRIDNDGNYERGNVRFITHMENCNNRRKRSK